MGIIKDKKPEIRLNVCYLLQVELALGFCVYLKMKAKCSRKGRVQSLFS